MKSIRYLLVLIALVVVPSQAYISTSTITASTSFDLTLSSLSQPQIAIELSLSTTVTDTGFILFSAVGDSGSVETTLTLSVVPNSGQVQLIPPCEVASWNTKVLHVNITYNTTVASVPVTYVITVAETDPFAGQIALNDTVTLSDSLPYANYYLTVNIPASLSPATSLYNVTLTSGGTLGNPFSQLCIKVGSCYTNCAFLLDITTPQLALNFELAPGTPYFFNFTVTAASVGHATATTTVLVQLPAPANAASTTAGTGSASNGGASNGGASNGAASITGASTSPTNPPANTGAGGTTGGAPPAGGSTTLAPSNDGGRTLVGVFSVFFFALMLLA